MTQPFRPAPEAKQSAAKGEVVVPKPFDYTPLATKDAQRMHAAAQRIRLLVQRTLGDVIAIGQELLSVKETLPHGQFSAWLRAEFDWTLRTAQRFMAVAQRFGSKSDTMSVMRIDLTAAYMLAAPTAPQKASEAALQRAQSGERITTSIAKKILSNLRTKLEHRERGSSSEWPSGKLRGELLEMLESFRRRWSPGEVSVLARQLRDFADSLEEK
jgi:hypothetical protein